MKRAMFYLASLMFVASALAAQPFNRIVIILDASGTFRPMVHRVLPRVQQLVQAVHSQHTRWQADDQIYIIALTGTPFVAWYGTQRQLNQLSPEALKKAFGMVSFPDCTDVAAAFNLAAEKFGRTPKAADEYLFSFSDLIDEPVRGNGCAPARRPSPPPAGIRWGGLSDASIVAYDVDDREIQAWKDKLANRHLSLEMYDPAESQNTKIPKISPAMGRLSAEEMQQGRQRLWKVAHTLGKFLGLTLLCVLAVGLGLPLVARLRGRHLPEGARR